MLLCCSLSLLFWSSCSTAPSVQYVVQYQYVEPPPALLRQCKRPTIRYATNGELVTSLVELNTAYEVCAKRVSALVTFHKKAAALYTSAESTAPVSSSTASGDP
jgi:hypothetical protein